LVAHWWRKSVCATTTVRLPHGVVAQRTAITPNGDGALMAQWRTDGRPILLPHAEAGSPTPRH